MARSKVRRVVNLMLVWFMAVGVGLVYFANASHPAPTCDSEETLIYARNVIATRIGGTPGVKTDTYIKVGNIKSLGVTEDGSIRCQATFDYSGQSRIMSYTLRGLRGTPPVEVVFDPTTAP